MDSRTLLGHTTESSHNRYLRSKIVHVAQPVPARRVRKSYLEQSSRQVAVRTVMAIKFQRLRLDISLQIQDQ